MRKRTVTQTFTCTCDNYIPRVATSTYGWESGKGKTTVCNNCGRYPPVFASKPIDDRAAWELKATQSNAIELCLIINDFIREYGAHIALTGGCLYREGGRKDIDLVIYRIRQEPVIKWVELKARMAKHGIVEKADHGFCSKYKWSGFDVDILWPECPDGKYPPAEVALDSPVQ